MSKEKQIEEMAEAIGEGKSFTIAGVNDALIKVKVASKRIAESLYNVGYRKQSKGEWILTGTFKSTFPLPVADLHEACSVCRWIPPKYSTDYKEYNYCPNCGAKMKGEQ